MNFFFVHECACARAVFVAERIPGQARNGSPALRRAQPREGTDGTKGGRAAAGLMPAGGCVAGAEIQPEGPALTPCYRCCLVLLGHGRWERQGRNRGGREGRDSAEDTRTRSVGRYSPC